MQVFYTYWRCSSNFITQIVASMIYLKVGLHDAICRPDSFVFALGDCPNFKAIRHKSTRLNRIVADKSHRVIIPYEWSCPNRTGLT